MSDEQKRGVGRPPKLTLDEKKDIVNRYLIQQGNDPSVLRAYGVNARLANFAKSLDSRYLCVRGYDFSEDEIQHYMLRLGRELSVEDQAKLVGCAYTPLDFGVVVNVQFATERGNIEESFQREKKKNCTFRKENTHDA